VSSFSVPFSLFLLLLTQSVYSCASIINFFFYVIAFLLSLFLFNKNQNNIFSYLLIYVRFICMDDHDFGGKFFFSFIFRISTHGRSKKRALITYQYVYYLLFLPFFFTLHSHAWMLSIHSHLPNHTYFCGP
jgi:hypothetical protein